MNEENKYEITCTNCGNTWHYHGNNHHYATCPDCQRKTRVPKSHPNHLEEDKL